MPQPITTLRQRVLDDMALRNMSPATQRGYIQQFSFSIFEDALWGLARFFEE